MIEVSYLAVEAFDGTSVEPWADDPQDDEDTQPALDTTAYLRSADWTVETLLSQLRQSNIDVSPQFQRRTVWTPPRMSRYIESLILGIPVPQLVLATDVRRRGAFIVLDGKQRLSALQAFSDGGTSAPPLKLSGLKLRPDLNGMTFAELVADARFEEDVRAFLNATIRTLVIADWKDERYLSEIFHRLNTGSVALASQELRQALYPGDFSDEINQYSVSSSALHHALRTDQADFRMRDTELALRFVAFRMRLPLYGGNLRRFLDETAKDFNADWGDVSSSVRTVLGELDQSIEACLEVFGPGAFRRFSNGRYQSLFNRAVFDAQALAFTVDEWRDAAVRRPREVRQAFEDLTLSDSKFVDSISATTKSIEFTAYRLRVWGDVLNATLGTDIDVVQLDPTTNRLNWSALAP